MIPSFFAWVNAWFLLLLIPLIIFYFLKLKRPRMEIPSLVLWQQALRDQRVNSPFQRFKKHLLLLLQILLLLAAVLAAMQPYRRGDENVRNLPVLIDVSASMGARSTEGDTSLEAAKAAVSELIDNLLPDQRLCLIAFGHRADKLTGFTDNRRVLYAALEKLAVRDVPSNVENALRLTQALAQSTAFTRIRLFSDGNLPDQVDFGLSFFIDYQRIGEPGPNMGITSISAEHIDTGRWALLVKVRSAGGLDEAGRLEIFQDNVSLSRELFTIGRGEERAFMFEIENIDAVSIRAEVRARGFDGMTADNTAFLELPAPRPLTVYVPAGLHAARRAFKNMKGVILRPEKEGDAADGLYDLVVSDRVEDLEIKAAARLFMGVIPPTLTTHITREKEADEVVDWQRRSPLLEHVAFNDLVILDRPAAAAGTEDTVYENLGFRVIMHGTQGPLMLREDDFGVSDYWMLFHPDQSTLPYRVGFPVMMTNLLRLARYKAGLAEVRGPATGIIPDQVFPGSEQVRVETPFGPDIMCPDLVEGLLTGVIADYAGQYTLHPETGQERVLGFSLLSSSETELKRVKELSFDEGLKVTAGSADVRTDQSLWVWLALAGFVLMMAEWWLFHRRPVVVNR